MSKMIKTLAATLGALVLIALTASSASAAYTDFDLTVDGVSNPNTAALSSSTDYTVTASGLEANHDYYVSTCVDPGTSGLSSPPACAFTEGYPYVHVETSDSSGDITITDFQAIEEFTDVHGAGNVTCTGASTSGSQCAVVVVDAEDHTLATDYDRVLITVD